MKIKKMAVIVGIIALLAVGTGLVVYGRQPEADSSGKYLTMALAATGADLREWTVSAWTKLPQASYQENELTMLVRSALADCGADLNQLQVSSVQGKRFTLSRAKWQSDGVQISAVAQTIDPQSGGAKESYLSIRLEKAGHMDQLPHMQQKIRSLMSKAGGESIVSTCVLGWLDGKLERDFLAEKVKMAFEAANAEQGDGVAYPGFISYSGYGRHLGATVQAGNKPVNINIAMRYSSTDDRTYVLVGSPLITQEY